MNLYGDTREKSPGMHDDMDGQNTMAVLNTLSGGEDVLAEGEPLGLDAVAEKGKLSGSTLAVGVVIVLGAAALFGMRMTLGAIAGGDDPAKAISEIEVFMAEVSAAKKVNAEGPIRAADDESRRVLEELKDNPVDKQVPAEEVNGNPFDFSDIVVVKPPLPDEKNPITDPVAIAKEQAKLRAAKLRVDSISGNIAFINGELIRVGDVIGDSGFTLESIDGLKCIIKTTDQFGIRLAIVYK